MDEIEASMNEDPKDPLPFSVLCTTEHPQQFPVYVLTGWIGWYHILTSMSAAPNSLISMIRTQNGVTAVPGPSQKTPFNQQYDETGVHRAYYATQVRNSFLFFIFFFF